MLDAGGRHSELDMPEEPPVLGRLMAKEARDTESVTLKSLGYARALDEVDNRTGKGKLFDHVKEESRKASGIDPEKESGIDPGRVVLLARGGYRGVYCVRNPDQIIRLGEVDAVIFRTRRWMRDIRRMMPPTLAFSLSRHGDNFFNGRIDAGVEFHEFANGVRRRQVDHAREVLSAHATVTDPALTALRGIAEEDMLLREYMRHEARLARNLPDEAEVLLFEGGLEALRICFAVLSASGKEPLKLATQPHEYHDALQAAQNFNYDIRAMHVEYGNVTNTAIPENTDVVYLSIPNNPHGLTMELDEIQDFIRKVPHYAGTEPNLRETTIVLDVVGYDHTQKKSEFVKSLWEMVRGLPIRVVIVDSFSKSEALAEERIGFCLSNDPDFTSVMRTFELPHISPLTVRAYRKQKRRREEGRGFETESMEYVEAFHRNLREIVGNSNDAVRIYRPNSAAIYGKYPSGYYVTIEFRNERTKLCFFDLLQEYGKARTYGKDDKQYRVDRVDLPLSGALRGAKRIKIPQTGRPMMGLNGVKGMPYMHEGRTVRLCAAGPSFQLDALIDAITRSGA